MGSLLNISEGEKRSGSLFLGLAMRLMYLIANPRLTAHFLDNPGFDSQKVRERNGEEKRAQDSIAYSGPTLVAVC